MKFWVFEVLKNLKRACQDTSVWYIQSKQFERFWKFGNCQIYGLAVSDYASTTDHFAWLRVNYVCQEFLKMTLKQRKQEAMALLWIVFIFVGWISRNIGYKDIYGFFCSWHVFASGQFPNGRERLHLNYKNLIT